MDSARTARNGYAERRRWTLLRRRSIPSLTSFTHYEVELHTQWVSLSIWWMPTPVRMLSGQKDLLAAVSISSETTKPSGQKPVPSGTVQDIGYAQAKSIALNRTGVSENQAYDMDIELDDEDGKLVYEIEFKSGGMEYNYEINAATGAILKHEAEIDD